MEKKIYGIVYKEVYNVSTTYGNVDFVRHVLKNISCEELEMSILYPGVRKGDKIRIIKGRKNPIGTEGIVKWTGPNQFGYTFNDALTGRTIHCNPSILLTLEDGSEVWTTGNNCINISHEGLEGILEFNSEKEYEAYREVINNKYKEEGGTVWQFAHDEIVKTGFGYGSVYSKSYGIKYWEGERLFKETDSEVFAVIDDFVTDTYKFVRFSKEAKHDNLIDIVDVGTTRDMDDMWRGDTGLGAAVKAYKEAVAA